MAETDIDITIKAKAAVAAAFAEATKAMDALGKSAKTTADDSAKSGQGLGGFGLTLGKTFAGAGIAIGVATGAVTALAAGIVALGTRGADVADIEASFNQMNKTLGMDGPKALSALKKGFAGTISDFDLMKASNKALSLNTKITAEQFGVLARSARVLSDRTGVDSVVAFEKLTMAMATGKTKALAKIGVMVKGGNVIGSLTKMLKESGDAQFDFADAVAASTTFVTNFKDSLGKAIAQSPVVNAMLASFGKGLQASFGADQAGLINTLIGYVNKFAIFLVDAGDVALRVAAAIGRVWSGLKAVFHTISLAVSSFMDVIAGSVATVLELASKIPKIGDSYKGAATEARNFANISGAVTEGIRKQLHQANEGIKGNDAYGKGIESIRGHLATARGEMEKVKNSTEAMAGATNKGTMSMKDIGKETQELTKEQIKKIAATKKALAAADAWARGLDNLAHKSLKDATFSTKELKDHFEAIEKTMTIHGSKVLDILKLWREYPKAVESSSDKMKKAADKKKEAADNVSKSLADLSNAFSQMSQVAGPSLQKTVQWMGSLITTMNLVNQGTKSMKDGFSQLSGDSKNLTAGLTNIAAGAMSVYSSLMQATSQGGKFKSAMGGAMVAAQTASKMGLGPWGVAIAGVGGAIFGLFRGSARAAQESAAKIKAEAEKLAADTAAATAKMLADLQAQLAAAKTEVDGLLGKAKDMGYIFDSQANLTGVSFTKMRDVAQSYGIDLASLGPKFQSARLGDVAKTIIDDFTLLTKGGADVGGVLFGMKGKISDLVKESLQFGTSIPLNMKPWIDELDRAGLLTDADGKKLTDLSKLQFGDPIKTQFEQISASLLTAVQLLERIVSTIAAIPTTKTVTVTTDYVDNYTGERENNNSPNNEREGFAVGGIVNAPTSGMGVIVHGREAIIPLDKPSAIGAQLAREAAVMATSSTNTRQALPAENEARLQGIENALSRMTAAMTMLPSQLTRSFRDGNLQAGVSR